MPLPEADPENPVARDVMDCRDASLDFSHSPFELHRLREGLGSMCSCSSAVAMLYFSNSDEYTDNATLSDWRNTSRK